MLKRSIQSKWGRYGLFVISGILFLPTYCFIATWTSDLILRRHLDIGFWMRDSLPSILLCATIIFALTGFSVWNKPWWPMTWRQCIIILAALFIVPVTTSLLQRRP